MIIKLPFPPSSLSGHANGGSHWAKSKVTKKWRALALAETRMLSPPDFGDYSAYTEAGDINIEITFTPPDKRGDRVNFANRMKPLLDGVADGLGVNDARFVPEYKYLHPDKKEAGVVIEVKNKRASD